MCPPDKNEPDRLPRADGRLRAHGPGWAAANAKAIAHYNARIEREGLFSDRVHTFMNPTPEDGSSAER
jgi:hypothetical protein